MPSIATRLAVKQFKNDRLTTDVCEFVRRPIIFYGYIYFLNEPFKIPTNIRKHAIIYINISSKLMKTICGLTMLTDFCYSIRDCFTISYYPFTSTFLLPLPFHLNKTSCFILSIRYFKRIFDRPHRLGCIYNELMNNIIEITFIYIYPNG